MKRIKAGDIVMVISGDDKGKTGKVLNVLGNKVLVEKINVLKKFIKKNVLGKDQDGTVVELERPIFISKVQPLDPKTKKPVKVSVKKEGDKSFRFSKKSGEKIVAVEIEAKEDVKEEKKVKAKKVVKSKKKAA